MSGRLPAGLEGQACSPIPGLPAPKSAVITSSPKTVCKFSVYRTGLPAPGPWPGSERGPSARQRPLLLAGAAGYALIRKRPAGISPRDARLLAFFALDADGVREALKTLFWLAVIDLPLIFVVLQVIAGNNFGGQITFVTTLTYLFLAGTAVLKLRSYGTSQVAPGGAPALRPVAPRKTRLPSVIVRTGGGRSRFCKPRASRRGSSVTLRPEADSLFLPKKPPAASVVEQRVSDAYRYLRKYTLDTSGFPGMKYRIIQGVAAPTEVVEYNSGHHLKVRLNSSPSIPACLRMPFRVPLFNSRYKGTEKTRHPFCTTTWDEVCRCGTKPCRARYFTISSPETTGSLCDISYVNLRYLVTYS